jgi:hypothetical protein
MVGERPASAGERAGSVNDGKSSVAYASGSWPALFSSFEEVLSMAPRFRIFSSAFLLAVIGALTAGLAPTRAQTLDEGWQRLDDKFRPMRLRATGFIKGAESFDPNDKSQVEAIDLLAKNYTYAVYLKKLDTEPNGIKKDYEAFDKDVEGILKARDRASLQPLAEVLSDKVGIHALEVIQLKEARPIHKLHNARILAKIAELGHAGLAGTLVTILKDSQQNDAVQYWVLKGMETLLSQVQLQQAAPLLTKDQQAKCAEAIVEFLDQKQKKAPSKNAAPEEIDGFRFLRRAAIRALAKIHTPAINDKIRPALVLARFAGNDERIQPPPSVDERVEAAIGLARMEPGKDKQYQADYAAGQIAKCLGACAHIAETERTNKEARTHPWRAYATMFKESLETLKKNNEKSANPYVIQIADRGSQLLKRVLDGAAIEGNEQTWWRSSQSDPPSKELFQGSADSTVKPAPEEGAEG